MRHDFQGQSILAVAVMVIGVLAVYCPPALLAPDSALYGMDFWALHLRRLGFVHVTNMGDEAGSPTFTLTTTLVKLVTTPTKRD